jgi:XRE family transcriptional regulator, fatty acid utilization regulator
MAGRKIFAGAKLRRIRNRLKQNQADFAVSLGISPSYLNLIERDQRPLTAQVLLRLHSEHHVDLAELSETDGGAAIEKLKEVVSDPLLAGEIPLMTELLEAAQVAPNVVGATVKLYGAYREVLKRLGELSHEIVLKGGASSEMPFETVRRWMQEAGSQFPALEALAEDIWFELSPKDDLMAGLRARLRAHSGIDVRIIPADILGSDRSHYDRHSQRLLISEMLSAEDRLFETAWLLARLQGFAVIESLLPKQFTNHEETKRLARHALNGVLALAILCPAAKFSTAATDLRYDVVHLARRFNVTAHNAMQRLATLPEGNLAMGFICVDASGTKIAQDGKLGFHVPSVGALCGQLPIYDHAEGARVAVLKTAEGKILVAVAVTHKQNAAALILSPENSERTIYGSMAATQSPRPFGPTCRLCNSKNCALRREPPATRPAALNESIRGASDYEPI